MLSKDQNSGLMIPRPCSFLVSSLLQVSKLFLYMYTFMYVCVFQKLIQSNASQGLHSVILLYLSACSLFLHSSVSLSPKIFPPGSWMGNTLKCKLDRSKHWPEVSRPYWCISRFQVIFLTKWLCSCMVVFLPLLPHHQHCWYICR